MDSTSLIPVMVGDPHAIPRTPERQDQMLHAASNSPLESVGDNVLMPDTGTSAESFLLRDSPGAGAGANLGETGSPATVGSRIRPSAAPVALVAMHPRGEPMVSQEDIAAEFAGRSSFTAAMMDHAQTCSEPLVWQAWIREAFAVARGYAEPGPGQAPRGGVKNTSTYVAIRNAIYEKRFPDHQPTGSGAGSERGARSRSVAVPRGSARAASSQGERGHLSPVTRDKCPLSPVTLDRGHLSRVTGVPCHA